MAHANVALNFNAFLEKTKLKDDGSNYTERYLWTHSVMHHHNKLNVTKELATGSCVTQ